MKPAPLYKDIADAPEGGEAYWLIAADGKRVRAGLWRGGDRGTLLIFPGRTEFIEKYGPVVGQAQRRGFSVAVIDWRGQGLSERPAGKYHLGHVEDFLNYQHDVKALLDLVRAKDFPDPSLLLAHSMGGAIGLRALHSGLPVKKAIFSAPMWGIKMAPYLVPVAWFLSSFGPPLGFGRSFAPSTGPDNYILNQEFGGNTLTTDVATYAWLKGQLRRRSDLSLGGPSLKWMREAMKECRTLRAMPPPDVPGLCLLGSEEAIVEPSAIHDIMGRWPNGKLVVYEGAQHEILMESPEYLRQALDEMDQFIADI